MTPDRWRQISRIYHEALQLPPEARDRFVAAASAGDEDLEGQIQSLLRQSSDPSFLETPPWHETTDVGRSGPRRLGRFEVRGLLGAGGMGEVYRAHDSSLGRDVAVKILPKAFVSDPDRLGRFEREARVLAALNHPHIAAIYGIEEIPAGAEPGDPAMRALVLELVEGDTLAERLRRGPLRLSEALEIARQLADALDAAHEKGIVHRDLKPANIKVRPDGTVKVLDFGLAKAVIPSGVPAAGVPADPVTGESAAGIILGTPAYMSPEQARGGAVDKRTDVWAFGCLLYEMLAGRPAFGGDTVSDTLAAVLDAEPDLSSLPPDVPPHVRRVIARCLVKDRRRRLRDIADAKSDLDDAWPSSSAAAEVTGRWPRSRAIAWSLAGLAVVAAAGLGLTRFAGPARAGDPWSLERVTSDSGLTTMPTVSPDGQLMAFASDRAGGGDLDIWVRQTSGGVPLRLTTDPGDDHSPQFSPDAKEIVFRSERGGGGVYLVSALGGPERLIVNGGRSPRFSPDGARLAYWSGQFRGPASERSTAVFVVPLEGGTPTRLAPDFFAALEPVWAPEGRSLLFLGRSARNAESLDWWWAPLDGRAPVKTGAFQTGLLADTIAFQGEGAPAAWGPDGVLVTARGALWTIPIAADSGRTTGPARHLGSVTGRAESPTIGPDGSVFFAVSHARRVIERQPLARDAENQIPAQLYADNRSVALRASQTSDGATIVFDQGFESSREIWMRDTATGRQRLVLRVASGFPVSPTVSSDGARIAYTVAAAPGNEMDGAGYVVETSGGVPTAVCQGCRVYGFLSDHHRVLASWNERVLGAIDVRNGSRQELVTTSEGRLDRPHASPDDRWLAFRQQVPLGAHVYVVRLVPNRPPPQSEWQLVKQPTTTGRPCGWSPDSTTLYTLLDTDGFRCLWGQRVGARGPEGDVFVAQHLHTQMDNGPSTSFGNPFTAEGFLYERVLRTGDIWRLAPGAR